MAGVGWAPGALFWGCQMGWDGGQPWQWDTELLYSLQREKCHPPSGCGVFFPLFFLPFPPAFSSQLSARQFAGARHRQARLGCCPGSGQTGQGGTFGVNMWHVGVPKAWLVASICFSKSLSGSFTHVTARICWKRRGKHILCLPWDRRAAGAASRSTRPPGKRRQAARSPRGFVRSSRHQEAPPQLSRNISGRSCPVMRLVLFFLKPSFSSRVWERQTWLLHPVPGREGAQSLVPIQAPLLSMSEVAPRVPHKIEIFCGG